jgi:hypothetical protein
MGYGSNECNVQSSTTALPGPPSRSLLSAASHAVANEDLM